MITAKDNELIEQARVLTDFGDIFNLEKQAESGEAKDELHRLCVSAYLSEEFDNYGEN